MSRIYEREGSWYLDYRDANGVRRREKAKCGTEASAQRMLKRRVREERAKAFGGVNPNPENWTLADLMTYYLDTKMSEKARHKMRGFLRIHVIDSPEGGLLLEEVKAPTVTRLMKRMRRSGMALSSSLRAQAYIRAAYGHARRDGIWLSVENP